MVKLLATIPETCEAIGHKRSFVYELINSNRLETVKANRRRLVVVESIERYVASLRAAS